MATFIGTAIGIGLLVLVFRGKYDEILPVAAAVRYRWMKGGETRTQLMRLGAIGVPVLAALVWMETADVGDTGAMVIIGTAGVVWLTLRKRADTETAQQQRSVGDPVAVPIGHIDQAERLAVARLAVPRPQATHRLDFRVTVEDRDAVSVVTVHGPTGPVGIAVVRVGHVNGAPVAIWDYEQWHANENGASAFADVLTDLRDRWIESIRAGLPR